MIRLVMIESPYAGDVEANTEYARQCVADSLSRGEAPFASHLLYTQPGILDDTIPDERRKGIRAGLLWAAAAADLTAVYVDRGITPGMREGIRRAREEGRAVVHRMLDDYPASVPFALGGPL